MKIFKIFYKHTRYPEKQKKKFVCTNEMKRNVQKYALISTHFGISHVMQCILNAKLCKIAKTNINNKADLLIFLLFVYLLHTYIVRM